MSRYGRIFLALALAAAPACSAGAPAPHPQQPLPPTFSATGSEAVPERWWNAFDDPILDGLVGEALADNPSLLATWARLAQAQAAARRQGASRYPTLDASAGGSAGVRGDGDGTTRDAGVSLGLAAGYEVDLWGGIAAEREAAAIDARASAEDLRVAALTLSAQVATTWYGLVEQRRQYELLEAQAARAQQTLDLVQLLFDRAQVAETDLLRQRQRVESLRGDQALARARIAVLEHQLAVLLGRPPQVAAAPRVTELVEVPPLPSTGVPGELVQRRPDVVRAWLRVESADRRVAVAITERFPRLSLSLRASTAAASPQALFETWLASLAGNLVAPLLDGGRRKAEVERARAALDERLHEYRGAVLAALGEVEDALARELEQHAYLDSLMVQLELSAGVLERARAAYAAGMSDYLRVLDAEETHQALERRLLQAQAELIQVRIGLYRALAGGWALTPPGEA